MAVILVMDDYPGIRDMLQESLNAAGHEVFAASNGQEGIILCNAHPPDVVIIDMFMPVKEGLETIQELRSKRPQLKMIAMSGAPSDLKILEMAKKLGAHEVLRKPFRPEEIISAVNRLLQSTPPP